MAFKLGLAQCRHPEDGNVVASVERWASQASDAGVDLLVFPEALMTKFDGSVERFVQQAQPTDGPFAQAVDQIAARYGLWLVYTMNERNPHGALPFNTAILTDSTGTQRARYRKVHLFDAQGYSESERMAAGSELMQPVETPFATIGLAICYDLRFPEVARHAALNGAMLMLYPAAWVDGPEKVEQWETLLRARAIENGIFVAGACSCDEHRIGHSCAFAPTGTPLVTSNEQEQLVTCTIVPEEVAKAQKATPTLAHRRPDCYK